MTHEVLAPETAQPELAIGRNVALYPSDIADIERMRTHFHLDSFSQALRRVIRIAVEEVDRQTAPDENGAAA